MQNELSSSSKLYIPGLPEKYCLLREIGSGSYGAVYTAKDCTSGKIVAIKYIKELFFDLIDGK